MMDIYEIFVFFLFGKLTARKTKTKEATLGEEENKGIEHIPDLGGQKEGRER